MIRKKNYFFIWDKNMLRKNESKIQINVKYNKTNNNINYRGYFKIADRAIFFTLMIIMIMRKLNAET